ncbi:MAG: protein kinase [Phycisphaerae bacterium]|nr:protein kinase [Phycisphaerae bacterium]
MTNDQTTGRGGLQPGDRIGKYEVRELLGAGGQSLVFKAYDATLDRFVAVKQVAPHLAVNEEYLAVLRENLRKIAHLGQHNDAVVTIHDVIEDPRGVFYVMEFVEGHTLERLIAESPGPVEPKAALLILFRLAAALHDVHSEGIIHRDMKPGNIILTEGLRPKIIDFGVAAFGGQDASMPLATTKYLAPELYSRPDADARADLYSLGFIAYEMLLGRQKFNEIFEDVVRDPHSAALRWMKWHGNESVVAPRLHEVNPAVPRALSDIVARLIEKDPQKRFADAEELGRAIKTHFSAKFRRPGGEAHAEATGEWQLPAADHSNAALENEDLHLPETPTPAPGVPAEETPTPEGPSTAPLPKTPMSRGKRIAVIAVTGLVFLGILGGGIAWLLHVREKNRARALSAVRMYDEAVEFYDQGNYAKARETFEQLRKRHSGTTRSAKAEVLEAMCRAQIAIEQRQWAEAQIEEQRAIRAAETLQERGDDKALDDWSRERINQVEQIKQTRLSTNTFWDAMDQAAARLDQAAKAADFDEILREFNRQLGASGVGLTPAQESQVGEMQRQIEQRKFLFIFEQHVGEGDALLARREYDAASAAYVRGEDMLRDETSLQTIPPEQRDSLLRQVDAKKQTLSDRRRTDQTLRAIRDAEKAKDAPALKKALAEALELPSISAEDRKVYRQRLRGIEADEAVASARTLYENKQYDKALEALDAAKKIQPDHLGAQTLRAKVQTARLRHNALQAGDQAVAEGKLPEALKQYRQAEKFGADEEIKNKIRDTDYEIHIKRAEALVKEQKYDQAEVVYAEAIQIKPSAKAHVETMRVLMQTQRKYGQSLARGNDALKRNRWQEAIRWFKQARQQTQDPREVDERISETYYRKFLTGGKKALAEENLPVARWSFKQALRYKETPEAQKLLRQAGGGDDEK